MSFVHERIIAFQDTDAAGVVYFAQVFAIAHEAYEASLAASGINLRSFFSNADTAVPIVHASVDFFRPLFCGDRVVIHLKPTQLSPSEFEITYTLLVAASDQPASIVHTRHVCIATAPRARRELPSDLMQWLQTEW